jgi:hypothetical protein
MAAPYYERHLTAVATLLVEKDIVTCEELQALVRVISMSRLMVSYSLCQGPSGRDAYHHRHSPLRSATKFVSKTNSYLVTCGCPRTFAARLVSLSASRRCIRFRMLPVTPCKRPWSQPTTPLQVPRPVAGQLRRCSEPCRRLSRVTWRRWKRPEASRNVSGFSELPAR